MSNLKQINLEQIDTVPPSGSTITFGSGVRPIEGVYSKHIFVSGITISSSGLTEDTVLKVNDNGEFVPSTIKDTPTGVTINNELHVEGKIMFENYATITYIIDGGDIPIILGIKGDLEIPFDCEILSWSLFCDPIGSIELDIYKSNYDNYPPTVSITGTDEPKIVNNTKNTSTLLTGWNKNIVAGEILRFDVVSLIDVTRATISIKVLKK